MEALEIRKIMKKRKPQFIRQDAHKKKRLAKKWHKPKGLQSKMREMRKGHSTIVKPGFRSPIDLRHTDVVGRILVRVENLSHLKGLTKDKHKIILSRTTGQRKGLEILKKVKEMGIEVLHLRDIAAVITTIEEKRSAQKKNREQTKTDKESQRKELEKKIPVDKLAEKVDEEVEKSNEKKELDKLLTKKQ